MIISLFHQNEREVYVKSCEVLLVYNLLQLIKNQNFNECL